MKSIITIVGAVFLCSCVTHKGFISPTTSFSSQKSIYKDIAVGYSRTTYFMGIGGFSKDLLISDAKRNLYMSYTLKPNQSFENLSLDIKSTIIWPYKKTEAIIIADVVEHENNHQITFDENYSDLIFKNKFKEKNYIFLNEKVLLVNDSKFFKGTVVRLNKRSASVFFIDNKGEFRIKDISYENIYKTISTDSLEKVVNFKINENVIILDLLNNGQYSDTPGTIAALNGLSALIQTKFGKKIVEYKSLAKIEK